jgi:ankyrin repeat protein
MFSAWKKQDSFQNIDKALLSAAGMGDILKVQHLLAINADINVQDGNGWTPLHRAIDGRHKEVVKLLIYKEADVTVKDFTDHSTPLHWIEGKEEAELLIIHGADVNARNRTGFTPLHLAVMGECLEVAELLIINGAIITAKTDEGWTAFSIARRRHYTEIAAILSRYQNGKET